MQNEKRSIEVCLTPAIYSLHHNDDSIVIVVDVLRATSGICTAFMNGVKHIIPVGSVEDARRIKEEGYLLAAERDGTVLDFADFGNSPFNFKREVIQDREIAYSTTNGTNAINMASNSYKVLIGSFLNLTALVNYIKEEERDVVIFCAGWKNRYSLEDTVFAGALSQMLMDTGKYDTICDAAVSSMDLWGMAKVDLYQYILKAAQKQRLAKKGLDDVIEFCCTIDLTNIVPIYTAGILEPEAVEVSHLVQT